MVAITGTQSVGNRQRADVGLVGMSTENAITAFAGGGQASGYQLTAGISRVTTVATAGDSVKMHKAKAGLAVIVINAAAANSMDVFPASGDAINAIAANGAFAIA